MRASRSCLSSMCKPCSAVQGAGLHHNSEANPASRMQDLADVVAMVIGSNVDPNEPLMEAGLDSISAPHCLAGSFKGLQALTVTACNHFTSGKAPSKTTC